MKKLYVLSLIAMLWACQNDAGKSGKQTSNDAPLDVQLTCEDMGSTDEAPHYAIYAIINNNKTKIMEATVACQTIGRESYENYQIPAEAMAAVGGWWAGGGDYFYAKKEAPGKVIIYHAAVDESITELGYPYAPIATYDNGKFLVQLPNKQ